VWCSLLVVVHAAQREIGGSGMRAFLVRLRPGFFAHWAWIAYAPKVW